MKHTVSTKDFENYVVETILCSSSKEDKKIVSYLAPITNEVLYKLFHHSILVEVDVSLNGRHSIIAKYNEI